MAKPRTKAANNPNTITIDTPEGKREIQAWEAMCLNDEIEFFDLLRELPAGAWDQLSLYMYRLEPAVNNRQGDKKYITCIAQPIDQDWVKNNHGGGKYYAILKHDTNTVREHKFWIEGEPKLIEGQTLKNPPLAATPQSDLASVVKQVIEATKGDSKHADAGVDILKKAFTDGLELQKTITTANLGSATGNALTDKLLEKAIEKMNAPPAAPASLTEQLAVVKEIAKIMRPDNSDRDDRRQNPVSELSLVKDLLGVDSLKELIDVRSKGNSEQPWWVGLISTAIDKLPMVLTQVQQMSQQAFERALIAHRAMGTPGALMPPGGMGSVPSRPIPSPGMTTPAPAPGGSAAIPQEMVAGLIGQIVRAYDGGYPGDMAAAHVSLAFPDLVEALKPVLTDSAQLGSFVQQIPELAERSREPEWAEFQDEFIQELLGEALPPLGAEPGASVGASGPVPAGVTPFAPGATIDATESQPERRGSKKAKANGHAAN
jgi:hypothetical protein